MGVINPTRASAELLHEAVVGGGFRIGAVELGHDLPPEPALEIAGIRSVGVEVVARQDGAAARQVIAAALEERGVPLRTLRVVAEPSALHQPVPLRCDLRETGFSTAARADGPVQFPIDGTPLALALAR